ncbi:unnamed protein product [Mytilus edulis]|uniref:Uncharacterized protein n=1 Tax=Mytilus edulis TaxID=6550 RepID=A0A8S3QYE1_MYTED|nr:unnamed protein product [Mytilus edulis]
MTEWSDLERSGKLLDNLIVNLLDKVQGLSLTNHKDFVLQIMEKFDIIVRPLGDKTKQCMYMPCMIKAVNMNVIARDIGNKDCKKTSWFCLQFDFLPPSYFNHILVSFVKQNKLWIGRDNRLGIYRNVGVFSLNSSGSKVLLICLLENSIAMQVWQWKCGEHDCYSDIKNKLLDLVNSIKLRYRININYEKHFKCSDGFCQENDARVKVDVVIENVEYYCSNTRACIQAQKSTAVG